MTAAVTAQLLINNLQHEELIFLSYETMFIYCMSTKENVSVSSLLKNPLKNKSYFCKISRANMALI